ncbi:MAG: hypothetical protein PHY46_00120 [Candidatus Omnitrophica bacterium]|nr:hypothetical protein [Candidatus Omnitrophota bacterium]
MDLLFSLEFIYFVIGAIFLSVISYYWLYRIRKIVSGYLNISCEIISCQEKPRKRLMPLYSKGEIEGVYKGRQVIIGIQYIGLGFEWMPLPYIRVKLKDVIRYNYNRIPDFAFIQSGWLVFRIKDRLTWGILDKNYTRFFTEDFMVIALTRLLSVAEDAERGKTLEEIFK